MQEERMNERKTDRQREKCQIERIVTGIVSCTAGGLLSHLPLITIFF